MENERMNFEPMKPDHTTSQGPGYGLIAGKRSPIALVCALLLVALSGCGALLSGRAQAWKVQCSNSLKQIYFSAAAYAGEKKGFPLDGSAEKPRAQDSLNIFLKSKYGKNLPPHLFKCPAGEAVPAKKAEAEDYLQLDEDTLDYAWANIRRRPTGKLVAIGSDKFFNGYDENREGHNDVMNVLNSDSSIKEWEIGADGDCEDEDFDADLGLPTGLGR